MTESVACEWGLHGVQTLREHAAVLIIVDVLSFSTAVDVALARGASIIPFPLGDPALARAAAESKGALLATPRRAGAQFSLSPATLRELPAGAQLLLPSPNGSRLSLEAAPVPVFTACLRNFAATAAAAAQLAGSRMIGVIPAGERWPDDTLRPAIEDWCGAGAVIDALDRPMTAEAKVARDAFRAAGNDLPRLTQDSLSGRELIDRGFAIDVELASAIGISAIAPQLVDGAYRPG
jgi:2-phosphosulfolactate phosphatase